MKSAVSKSDLCVRMSLKQRVRDMERELLGEMDKDSMATEAPSAPVTYERRVSTDLEDRLPKPCKLVCSN